MKEVAEIIVESRLAKGWGQAELSAASDVAVGTISNLERGKTANPRSLRRLAKALEIDVKLLLPSSARRGSAASTMRIPPAMNPSEEIIARLKELAPDRQDFVKLARKVGHDILSAANYHEGHVDIAAMDLEDPSKED